MVLVTGASGLVGAALVRRFLREGVRVCALVHRHAPRFPQRVEVLRGDITRPRLGLAPSDYGKLTRQLTGILHSAARTDFALSQLEADRANLIGTQEIVAFARDCTKLRKLAVISTVYTAGRRKGTVLESELSHRVGFVNAYEQSKYGMEQFLRTQMSFLPISIYRLGTIIGNARSGRVEKYGAIHHALHFYHRGLVPMVPGEEDQTVELTSSDFAADAIFHLFHRNFRAAETYHIVTGESKSLVLLEFLETTACLFARFDSHWNSRQVAIPAIVPLKTFRLFEDSVRQTGNSVLCQIVSMMSRFAPQLCYPKRFDNRNATRDLAGSGIAAQPLRTYYPRIIQHCVGHGWGAKR